MPYCAGCGTQVTADALNCPSCGRPTQAFVAPLSVPVARRTEGQAVASLILGVAGIVVCPFVCSIIAIVLGNQARARIAADPSLDGADMARAGVILGWVGVGLGALGVVVFVLAFMVNAASWNFG